jgi:TolA-binding protein
MKSDFPALIAAYREENPGTSLDARALRERVLAATWRRRRRRLRRAVWLFPIAAVLVGSGALAASAPAREGVSRMLARLGVIAPVAASLSPAPARQPAARRSGVAPVAAASGPSAPAAAANPTSSTNDLTIAAMTTELVPSSALSLPSHRDARADANASFGPRATAVRREQAPLAAPGTETHTADPDDSTASPDGRSAADGPGGGATTAKMAASNALAADIVSYRSAHELHFGRADYAGALAAWNAYLARFPHGTFAPEARLNRAVCLARLGETEQARTALRALSAGPDEYTRTRARLLQAALGGVH